MCLDSSSQSQTDAFKLVFDQQSNSKVRENHRISSGGNVTINLGYTLAMKAPPGGQV